eukprot:TRINITY_DN18281_c0_g1_i1.p1 TRINITY_DN18281_c0_g1~~TRINITY_DN18281_c0_g1_i1.p1  ORF type:complete len:694 (+),score=130.70 TRINITY_DN18281_c0_g1_i1:64-2082(+)
MPYALEEVAVWLVEDVQRVLRSECQDWAEPPLLSKLLQHEVDGAALLELTKDDLRDDLGVRSLGRIKRVLRGIRRLVAQEGPRVPAPPDSGADEVAQQQDCDVPISAQDLQPHRTPTPQPSGTAPAQPPRPPPAPSPPCPARPAPPQQVHRPSPPPPPPAPAQRVPTPQRELRSPLQPVSSSDISSGDLGIGPDAVDISLDGGESPQPRHRRTSLNPEDIPARPVTAIGHRPMDVTSTGTPVPGFMPSGHNHVWEDDPAPVCPPAMGGIGFPIGILERERRYGSLRALFKLWDESSDVSVAGSGTISFAELRDVMREYYGWTKDVAEARTRAVLDTIDSNSDGLLDFFEFHAFMSTLSQGTEPRDFDAIVDHLRGAVTRVAEAQETLRRKRLLSELFDTWDDDGSGRVDDSELVKVLGKFNEGCAGSKDNRELSELRIANSDGTGLDRSEFVDAFMGLTRGYTAASFDLMYYRLMRVLEDVILSGRRSANVSVGPEDLEDIVLRSSPTMPLIMYGGSADPSKSIERCAGRFDAALHPFLITHDKAEQEALRALSRLSMSRGWWIYLVIGQGYRCDSFFREIGVRLQTASQWSIHRRFRLWIRIPSRTLGGLPNILLLRAVAVSVDNYDPVELLHTMGAPPDHWRVRRKDDGCRPQRPSSAMGVRGHVGHYAS